MCKKKEDRRIKRTKHMLKDALISLLNEREFCSISITDIVTRSDLNRSTFYAHFTDKEELLAHIIDELIKGVIHSMQEPSPADLTKLHEHGPSQATINLFTYVADHAAYFKTMLNDQRVPQFVLQLSNTLYQFFINEMENDQRVDDPLTINKGFYASYLTSVVVGFIYHWIMHTNMKYTPDYIAKELTKLCQMKPYIPYLHPKTNRSLPRDYRLTVYSDF